jgi:hypothetical protein
LSWRDSWSAKAAGQQIGGDPAKKTRSNASKTVQNGGFSDVWVSVTPLFSWDAKNLNS